MLEGCQKEDASYSEPLLRCHPNPSQNPILAICIDTTVGKQPKKKKLNLAKCIYSITITTKIILGLVLVKKHTHIQSQNKVYLVGAWQDNPLPWTKQIQAWICVVSYHSTLIPAWEQWYQIKIAIVVST